MLANLFSRIMSRKGIKLGAYISSLVGVRLRRCLVFAPAHTHAAEILGLKVALR